MNAKAVRMTHDTELPATGFTHRIAGNAKPKWWLNDPDFSVRSKPSRPQQAADRDMRASALRPETRDNLDAWLARR